MIFNYIKIVLRTITKNATYSFLNIFGLALGLACCFLTLIYVLDEVSYDGHLADASRLYRVIQKGNVGGNKLNMVYTPSPMSTALLEEFPQVESVTRLHANIPEMDPVPVQFGQQVFMEKNVLYADSNALEFFGIKLIKGNQKKALSLLNSVVLSEPAAKRYFNSDDPIGKTLKFVDLNQEFVITGVAEPLPSNSHFHFDFLASYHTLPSSQGTRWIAASAISYFKLKPGNDIEDLNSHLQILVDKYVVPQMPDILGLSLSQFLTDGGSLSFQSQAVKDIHLASKLDYELEPNSDWSFIYMYSSIASLILFLAIINFVNITTSKSASRAKEIGLRKVFGSIKKQLVVQFLLESITISLAAYLLALVLSFSALTFFNQLLSKNYDFLFLLNFRVLLVFMLIAFVVGIVSGLYPALFLASFEPAAVLKGLLTRGKKGKSLRGALVIIQYVIATTLLICTILVWSQVKYLKNQDLGFDKDQILVIQNIGALAEKQEYFVNELKSSSNIVDASYSTSLPGKPMGKAVFKPESDPVSLIYSTFSVDENFFNVFKMTIRSGEPFIKDHSTGKVIINEAAVKNLGWADPISRHFNTGTADASEIAGVVKDFNFQSLHEVVQPMVIAYKTADDRIKYLSIRIKGSMIENSVEAIRSKWSEIAPQQPFEFFFFDDSFDALYKEDERLGRAIVTLSVISTLVASLGLFGMILFVVNQRVKEIGIRKVLGSSTAQIALLINKEILSKVILAAFLAWPLSYLIIAKWQQGFAYHAPISTLPFLAATGLTLTIALATIAYQSVAAALANPVDSIRNP